MMLFKHVWLLLVFSLFLVQSCARKREFLDEAEENMVISTVSGKALYLFKDGSKHLFPDFHTFTAMGFNQSSIHMMRQDKLNQIRLGSKLASIEAPPVFRELDYMYHSVCENYPRLVNDLGIVANNGDFIRHAKMLERVHKEKKIEILALGGSITAGGYFEGFVRKLRENDGLEVSLYNHGHGATELTYTIFCIELERRKPDLVLIDFSVNDYGHPKLMDALIRKALMLGSESKQPVVALINLWVDTHGKCPTTRYLVHGQYYNLPVLNICPAVDLCFGRNRLPRYVYEQYSTSDGVHPWGKQGVPFIGDILYAWWQRTIEIIRPADENMQLSVNVQSFTKPTALPPPLYGNHVGQCTRCDALTDDADAVLLPEGAPQGFTKVTRVKVGFGGFDPAETQNTSSGLYNPTKSFKRSWQAETVGSTISFRFYGSSVKVAMWQRRDSMGILEAKIDNDPTKTALASSFFKGFTWAMERNNTGRSEVVPLFEGLEDKDHLITFTVTDKPANTWVPGHLCQIFALLSASDDANCKQKLQVKKEI
jgi:hypothetical protein